MRYVCSYLAISLCVSPVAAKARAERAQIALPIQVSAASSDNSIEQVKSGTIFGAQAAAYKSVATLAERFQLQNGLTLFEAGTRLFEHTAKSKSFTGRFFCKAIFRKRALLLCLADKDSDGAFDNIWLGTAVLADAKILSPALPQPDIEKLETSFTPIRYAVGQPSIDERLKIGFYISGHNPILGQTHFYLALSGNSDNAAITLAATHRSPRLSDQPSEVSIADGVILAQKTGKNEYGVRVKVPLKEGDRELVEEYETQTRIIFVPG